MSKVVRGTVRAQAQPYVAGLAASGISANQALAQLRELGLGYRRQDFLGDYRLYRGAEKAKDVGKYTRKDRYPGAASIVPTPLNIKDPYQHLMEVRRRDPRTGEEIEPFHFYFGMDSPALQGVIEAMAWSVIEEAPVHEPGKSDWEIISVTRLMTRVALE